MSNLTSIFFRWVVKPPTRNWFLGPPWSVWQPAVVAVELVDRRPWKQHSNLVWPTLSPSGIIELKKFAPNCKSEVIRSDHFIPKCWRSRITFEAIEPFQKGHKELPTGRQYVFLTCIYMSFCACHNLLNSYDLSCLMGKMNLIYSGFVQIEINHKRYERSTHQGLPKIRSSTSIGSPNL